MDATRILIILLLFLGLLFILLSIAATLIFIQILLSIKKTAINIEELINNFKINQEEFKIKILDFIEETLTKIRNLMENKFYPNKGGDNYAKRKKTQ